MSDTSAFAQAPVHLPRLSALPQFDSIRCFAFVQGNWVEHGKLYPLFQGGRKIESSTYIDTNNTIEGQWSFLYDSASRLLNHTYTHYDKNPVIRDSFIYDAQNNRIETERHEYWGEPINDDEWGVHWVRDLKYFYDEKGLLSHIGEDTLVRFAYDDSRILSVTYRGHNGTSYYDSLVEFWTRDHEHYLVEITAYTYSTQHGGLIPHTFLDLYGVKRNNRRPEVEIVLNTTLHSSVGMPLMYTGSLRNLGLSQITADLSFARNKQFFVVTDRVTIPGGAEETFKIEIYSSAKGTFHDTLIVSLQGGEAVQRLPLEASFSPLESVDTHSGDTHTDGLSHIRIDGAQLLLSVGAEDLTIHDITGRLMLHEANPSEQLDLSMLLRAQMYVVSVRLMDGRRVMRKIIL